MNSWLGQGSNWKHQTHLVTCIWIIFALIHTGSVNLTKWSVYIPCRGLYAQSKQRRIQRWLNNPRINIHRLYQHLIKAALDTWQEPSIYLGLDTSMFWEEYCLVRLCVIHRRRALPVVWRVMRHKSASVCFRDYQQMLQQAQRRLPTGVKVILLADRGFIHSELMEMLTKQLGWHYRIRLKSNSWIFRGGKGWCLIKDFHFNRGEAICLHHVMLHNNLLISISPCSCVSYNVNGEFWAIVSDEKTTLQTFC